jgi:phosphonate transport system permease protein
MSHPQFGESSLTSDISRQFARAETHRRLYTGFLAFAALLTLILGFKEASTLSSGDIRTGFSRVFDYPSAMVKEAIDFGFLPLLGLSAGFLPALVETLNIALLATFIGSLAGACLGVIGARNLGIPVAIVFATRRMLDIMRAFPELVIALFLIYLLGASPIPAMIAITVHTTGVLGKLFSEINESIDHQALVGLKASGASWLQQIIFGVFPQVSSYYVSYILLRIEINVRASTILGFVGAGGIGAELRRAISWGVGQGHYTIALFILIFLFIILVDQSSTAIRRRIIGHSADALK